jgi:hypothetical protein
MCYVLVNSRRAAKKHAVFSVSLSEWLGGDSALMEADEIRCECLFILKRASQETAHPIISDLRNARFPSVSLDICFASRKMIALKQIYIEGEFIEYCVADM